jgi:hypothetical protein
MRKIFPFLLILIVGSPLFALYNSNPSEPMLLDEGLFLCQENAIGLKVGYQGDYVWDRKLEARGSAHGRIDNFKFFANQGVLTINFLDVFEMFGSAGAMQARFHHRANLDGNRREYETADHFAWGAGARAIIASIRKVDLGVEGSYLQSHLPVRWNTLNGTAYSTRADMHYREWQIGIGLSYRVDWFTPYAAVKYSNVFAEMKHVSPNIAPFSHFTMHSRTHFGLALGCSLSTQKVFDLTCEVQLFDEQAITLAANFKL